MKRTQILLNVSFLALLFFPCAGAAYCSSTSLQNTSIDSDKPSLYVLAIGICKYRNYPRRNPAYACKDAQDFATKIQEVANKTFERISVKVLVDDDAKKASIESSMKEIIVRARSQDTFIFFYSGHGESAGAGKNQQFYLVPSDFDHARRHRLPMHAISASKLQYWLLQVESRHQFVILDSHKSSTGFQEFKARIDHENQILKPLAQRDVAILSIRSLSFEFSRLKNGLLTYITLQGLTGAAASQAGAVTVKTLVSYVNSNWQSVLRAQRSKVARGLISRVPDAGMPDIYLSGDDFVLGLPTRSGPANHARNLAQVIRPNQQPVTRHIPDAKCTALSTFRPATDIAHRRGKDKALLIATNTYDQWDLLNNPIRDAEALAEELNTRFGFETEVLHDPTIDCITDALYRYGRNKEYPNRDDQLLIFFAGHGTYKEEFEEGFLVGKDSPRVDPIGRHLFPHSTLRRLVDNIPCHHIFLVIDACFSGTIDKPITQFPESSAEVNLAEPYEIRHLHGPNLVENVDRDNLCDFVTRKMQRRTRQLMTSGGKEYVPDGKPGAHSPFVTRLLESLRETSRNQIFVYISQVYPLMATAVPEPRWAPWGKNDSPSEFFFFTNECRNEN